MATLIGTAQPRFAVIALSATDNDNPLAIARAKFVENFPHAHILSVNEIEDNYADSIEKNSSNISDHERFVAYFGIWFVTSFDLK